MQELEISRQANPHLEGKSGRTLRLADRASHGEHAEQLISVLPRFMQNDSPTPVLAENTHPSQNLSLSMDNPFGLSGLTGRTVHGWQFSARTRVGGLLAVPCYHPLCPV